MKDSRPETPLPLTDRLVNAHADLRNTDYFPAITYITDESALAEHFSDSDQRDIASQLLFHAMNAAIESGFFNQVATAHTEGNEAKFGWDDFGDDVVFCYQTLKKLYRDLKGNGIESITSDFMVELLDMQIQILQDIPDNENTQVWLKREIQERMWHFNGRTLTDDEVTTIENDVGKVAYADIDLLKYIKERVAESNDRIVQQYMGNMHDGFIYFLGVKANYELGRGKGTFLWEKLTNPWRFQFFKFFADRNEQIPDLTFKHPKDKGFRLDCPPLPHDFEDAYKLPTYCPDEKIKAFFDSLADEYGQFGDDMSDEYIFERLKEWKRKTAWPYRGFGAGWSPGISSISVVDPDSGEEEIITSNEGLEQDESYRTDDDFYGDISEYGWPRVVQEIRDITIFDLWVAGAERARTPYTYVSEYLFNDRWARYQSKLDRFAARICKIIMKPDVFDTFTPQMQQLIQFFTGQDTRLENMLDEVDIDFDF